MFIVIDGIDGSGKGTQVDLLKYHLESLGKKVHVLDFPRYDEQSSFFVKKYLNGGYGTEVSAKQASLFYALDRFDAIYETYFETYDYMIANRYTTSNMIHQAAKISDSNECDQFLEWLEELEYGILWLPRPDKVIFLNVTPEMSQKLVLEKQERTYLQNGKKMDIHEADLEHLSQARERAMRITEKYENWIRIDCVKNKKMLSKEEITGKILAHILWEK